MPAEAAVKKKRNILKTILYSLLGLFIILIVVGCYLYSERKSLLSRYIEKAVKEKSKGLYHIRFSDIDINIFSGHLHVEDLELLPDTIIYHRFLAVKEAPDNLYHIRIKTFDIQNITATKALFRKILNIDSVLISEPELIVISKNQPYNDTVKEKPKTLYQLTKKIFKQVEIKGIILKSGSFILIDKNSKAAKRTVLNNVNIDVKEVLIDSLSEKDTSRFYASKNTTFRLKNYRLATPDSLYYLTVKDVYFSSRKRNILINQLAFLPRYSKTAFYQKVKLSKDRYDLKFNTIAINHIDLQLLVRKQKFFSSSANITNANIEVYNNNAYPEDKSEKPHWDNYPHQELQKVATAIKIDTLNLKNINVVYEEADKSSKQTGVISFNHIKGRIFNITNDSLSKVKNHYATAKLSSRILNAADLTTDFKFDLADKKGAFTYGAKLSAINGVVFNQTTVPLGLVKINSVAIKSLTFNANANNYSASGKLKLYYNNLNVELLKKEKGEKQLAKRKLISALANALVIKSDNPDMNNNFRTGLIKYKRPIKILFFNFLWKSLFTGIKSSAGLSAKMDTAKATPVAVKKANFVEKVGSFLGISKEKREQRKERREQKKADKHQKLKN